MDLPSELWRQILHHFTFNASSLVWLRLVSTQSASLLCRNVTRFASPGRGLLTHERFEKNIAPFLSPYLEDLDLSLADVTDETLALIAAQFGTHLLQLNLAGCPLVTSLASLRPAMPSLRRLKVSEAGIIDKASLAPEVIQPRMPRLVCFQRKLFAPHSKEVALSIRTWSALLGKMTIENYAVVFGKMMDALPSDLSVRDEILRLAIDKAIIEPLFASLYAKLLTDICTIYPPVDLGDGIIVSARDEILQYLDWQFEFRKDNSRRRILLVTQSYATTKTELDDMMVKVKRFEIGMLRLLSETVAAGLLPTSFGVHCLSVLFNDREWEPFSRFIAFCGKKLDSCAESKPHMDEWFSKIAIMLKDDQFKRVTESRLRFLLLDASDARQSGWKSIATNLTMSKNVLPLIVK